ncbi:BufA1 family periplasmic bufferin-type metallophore [Magnetovibrio blakemorei]|uniref:Signal peptidase n=1 Tax=Magnetovibrio blakemorei TaxID=28181 RepID=A0A1E5QB26_9PROT|nr:DUF2282 domain-containing protein [Magnetovibrio blakemorei]OEJ69236.1 hypothetical protein BEN30_03890 [Magnetovibrio blakemorei]
MSVKSLAKAPLLAAAMTVALSAAAMQDVSAADMEKCYGIAKAGHNDCKTETSSCAGTAKMDHEASAFVAVPVGTCAKIAGGTLKPM